MTSDPAPASPPKNPLLELNWPIGVGLGVFALIRSLASITGVDELLGRPATPLLLTALVSLVWILVIGLSRVPRPFLTLVLSGAVYGVGAIVMSAILSPLLAGELQGPITNPFAIVSVLLTNLAWGALAGALALVIRRARRARRRLRPGGPARTRAAGP